LEHRSLTRELNDAVDQALITRDFHEAIRLYQQAFSDAGRVEAGTFAQERFEILQKQNFHKIVSIAPQLRDIEWQRMAFCIMIEIAIGVAYYVFVQPLNLRGVAIYWSLGAVVAISFNMQLRAGSFRERLLMSIPMMVIFMFLGASAYHSRLGDWLRPPLLIAFCFGAVFVAAGFIPRPHRYPGTSS